MSDLVWAKSSVADGQSVRSWAMICESCNLTASDFDSRLECELLINAKDKQTKQEWTKGSEACENKTKQFKLRENGTGHTK